SKYGLKALLVLAQEGARGPALIADLAKREAMPKKFLETILLELRRHRFVESRRGRHGGYFLRRKPADITFGDVIRVLDRPFAAMEEEDDPRGVASCCRNRSCVAQQCAGERAGARRRGAGPAGSVAGRFSGWLFHPDDDRRLSAALRLCRAGGWPLCGRRPTAR